jgi:hypothetical protein
MRIKRNDFLNALRLVKPGAGEGLGGSKLVIFDNGWIRSLNERLSVSCKFETGIEGGLPIDQLYKALKIMKSDDIAVSSDKGRAVFKCGFSEMSLKLFGDGDTHFHVKKKVNLDDIKWLPAPKSLLEGLKLSLLSAEDTEIGKLAGVAISNSFILSSDNYRISMYEMGERIVEDTIRLRTSTVKFIVKMKKSFEFVSVSTDWFHLKSKDDLVISLRQMPLTDYPLEDILGVFDNLELYPEVYELPANLGQYIDRAEILAGVGVGEMNFDHQISLKSEDGNLVITGKNGVGKLSNRIPWSGVMPKLMIAPGTLRELLKITRSFKISSNAPMVEFQVPNFKFMMLGKAEQVQEQVTQKADTKQELATKLQHLRELRERRN